MFQDFTNSVSELYRSVVLWQTTITFFKIGVILAIFHSGGTLPEFKETLKMNCKRGAITSAVSFKN